MMSGIIILVILLSSGITCEAQYHNCFMSGDYSGRSTWCGENSKDEENLKDPVEIMKRAKEFLEKQGKIILDPMTWTIPPPTTLPPPPPPSSSTASAATISNPVLLTQPDVIGARSQPQYIPLYSIALPNGASPFFTPTSKHPADVSNLQMLPFVGIITPEMSYNHQNTSILTDQANLPFGYENSEQITGQQQQFQIQPSYLANKANEMPHSLKISPPASSSKFFVEKRVPKLKKINDLTDMRSIKPIKLVLNQQQHLNPEKNSQRINA
ncbi:hypothetical protein LOAG_01170 [Loa loa]|uniref:Uncharacterized protein n=2 Tax=Loa loa TaxID=7209 RepID=A0A1S0U9P0_LOALO|nr:hypothetical protein LOAG_01170 [Loa loa]EFO27306.1 hypothetical protein LOAG_01170 [Loa loa]